MRNDRHRQAESSRILLDTLRRPREIAASPGPMERQDSSGLETFRFIGQVYDGGSMPRGDGVVYLVHPVGLDGGEIEAGTATPRVDASRSIPVVVVGGRQVAPGDMLLVHAIGGRWVADSGVSPPNCNPQVSACGATARYAVNGTVGDPINGTQPLVFDYVKQTWFSPWLPFTSSSVLLTASGSSPCGVGSGKSYYFYSLTATTGQARLFLPGETCRLAGGSNTFAFYSYSGANYPSLLGKPANSTAAGATLSSSTGLSLCDPLTIAASFSGSNTPITAATFSVPKIAIPAFGYTCITPCPLPRKNLTLSWVNTGGNGSGTLAWSDATKDWTLACQGGRLSARLFTTAAAGIGFTATVWGGAGCSGTPGVFNYPDWIGLGSYTCDPLYYPFTVTYSGSSLYAAGYRSFAVTE